MMSINLINTDFNQKGSVDFFLFTFLFLLSFLGFLLDVISDLMKCKGIWRPSSN